MPPASAHAPCGVQTRQAGKAHGACAPGVLIVEFFCAHARAGIAELPPSDLKMTSRRQQRRIYTKGCLASSTPSISA